MTAGRPYIRVVDLETCGDVDTPDGAVIEVGWTDVEAMGVNLICEPADWRVLRTRSMLLDPGRAIRYDSMAIHHIDDDDVRGRPSWNAAAALVLRPERPPLAFCAHGAKGEAAWAARAGGTAGVPWLCTYKIGLRLWPLALSHSNQALRYMLRPAGLRREMAHPAHRAGPDSYVTAHTLIEAFRVGPSAGSLTQFIDWTASPALQTICRIGDWRGRRWTEVDDGMLDWILRKYNENGKFDEDVVFTVRHELARRQAERDAEYQAFLRETEGN